MSYARTGENSDVYVYSPNGDYWICGGCKVHSGTSCEFRSLVDLRIHMGWHLYSGHKVPAKVFAHIESELGETVYI